MTLIDRLKKLIEHHEEMAGNWNGDDERGEDQANYHTDVAEAAKVLLALLEEEYE